MIVFAITHCRQPYTPELEEFWVIHLVYSEQSPQLVQIREMYCMENVHFQTNHSYINLCTFIICTVIDPLTHHSAIDNNSATYADSTIIPNLIHHKATPLKKNAYRRFRAMNSVNGIKYRDHKSIRHMITPLPIFAPRQSDAFYKRRALAIF